MSGGISAIKGFDYQATVILDRLFDHFDKHGPTALVRPEGVDDLDLSWTAEGSARRRFEQVKKPREDNEGNRKPAPWTLPAVIDQLLPNTIKHLSGNSDEQVWIVGDEFDEAVTSLVAAGSKAPEVAAGPYWIAVHGLARNEALVAANLKDSIRQKVLRWQVPADFAAETDDALSSVTAAFANFATRSGAAEDFTERYRRSAEELHARLPGILARTQVLPSYGTEDEVAKRVYARLKHQYSLERAVIERTLFRNLRGFISDISKLPGRTFDRKEFEFELCSVWPRMVPIRDVPALDPNHISRPDLTDPFTVRWTGKAVEAVGISGSGKTVLTAEVVGRLQIVDPDRWALYAEVRPDTSLRDVLVGVAFHLRRMGIPEPFAVSVETGTADEEALRRLARACSTTPQEILLLLDLVEGGCSDAFARDLATFVRALSSSACRVAVLGQESGLRELSPLERGEQGVHRLDIPGFSFEEFVTLVSHHHSEPNRGSLWEIYQRVTAGRAAGLFAKLAESLARAQSLPEMTEISMRPADDILAHAEQRRFARISSGARSAAEKLVCFALPFRRKDAEEIFAEDNVGAAIRELQTQGLLRHHDGVAFEMHETVRAGLEGTIALSVRRSTHEVLATWYGAQGLVTAEILHLERAGRAAAAHDRARATFLQGKHWAALAPYVVGHKLVSTDDVIHVVAGAEPIEDQYLLPGLLRGLGQSVAVDDLFEILRDQPERLYTEYQWALAIAESILEFDPARLHDLVCFCLERISDSAKREIALDWLALAARRTNGTIAPQTIDFFRAQPPDTKRLLLRFMLLDGRRAALRHAFQFLAADGEFGEEQCTSRGTRKLVLNIANRDAAVELLAAIPNAEPAAMLAAKSVLLGPVVDFVWGQRKVLRAHCVDILREGSSEDHVLKNAIRVLIFLADPSICALFDPLLTRNEALRTFALLVPALAPAFCDRNRYEARLFDLGVALEERSAALFVLAAVGADLGDLYGRLNKLESDPVNAKAWDFWFLTLCVQAPFAEAIPPLEALMKSADPKSVRIVGPVLMKLSELPIATATATLIRALNHADPQVRQCATASLGQRRSRAALPHLINQHAKENVEALATGLVTAIVASGPRSVKDLDGRSPSVASQLWQCILAMRLRDESLGERLVMIANDPSQNWQLRRTAIFAAGRLPYEVALERIVPVIMAERSPFTIDRSPNLRAHSVVSSILLAETQATARFFAQGRAAFSQFLAEILENCWNESMSAGGLPSGTAAADWLFDRLVHHGCQAKREAPDLVLNELNVPLLHDAVVRSLRFCQRPDLIEAQLGAADYVWLAMKCLKERRRAADRDVELAPRLKSLVEASPCRGTALLHRVITEIGNGKSAQPATAPNVAARQEEPTSASNLSYDEALRILSGASAEYKPAIPFVLNTITAEQCERLIRLADPTNDRSQSTETYIPSVQFTRNGHVVSRRQVTHAESPNALVRPAIAVANTFGLPILWHQELMTGLFAASYIPKYLACLGAVDDSNRFYESLTQYEDVLISYLCDPTQRKPVVKYIDARLLPFLMRYVSSGTDEFFEGLCTLALLINEPEVDILLAGLLYRWTQRFDLKSTSLQYDQNIPLWRGFNRLSEHPRFAMIEGWQPRLVAVLSARMSWYRAENVVRVLERSPRSYILIESRLFRTANWEHFHQDEIDRLDAAAERLFHEVLDD